ncbi:hypothetical protein J4Q44_G00166670, partial [Coregonus suidteri]
KKTGALKSQERKEKEKEKERWREEKQQETVVKRQKENEEEEENVMPTSLDPLENGFINHAQREQERMNDRLLKKTYSKKNKQIKALQVRPVKLDEDGAMQEINRPNRSTSKEHLSESSTHSLSGRGYSNVSGGAAGKVTDYRRSGIITLPADPALFMRKITVNDSVVLSPEATYSRVE